jgi:hypothetical protein
VSAVDGDHTDDWWGQGRADPQREILDIESVAGHLLPSGGVFAAHDDPRVLARRA